MAVSLFYGMTESGKSYLARTRIEKYSRSVIFDYVGCFTGDIVTSDFSVDGMVNLFKRFKDKKKFKIVFRPQKGVDEETAFNKCAWFSMLLGRQAKNRGEQDRLIFLVDEADMICKPNYQSKELKNVVNWGRHELVDSWFIARIPQRLHTDIRANASEIFCFKLNDEIALNYLKSAIGKKASEKIKTLMKYSFLAWKNTGEIFIFNKDKKLIESWS